MYIYIYIYIHLHIFVDIDDDDCIEIGFHRIHFKCKHDNVMRYICADIHGNYELHTHIHIYMEMIIMYTSIKLQHGYGLRKHSSANIPHIYGQSTFKYVYL
jgi:hypothetical protein